ncbi:MAG: hypothetical protein Q8S10_13820, partial [Thiobacillus sp.]|nr:hypothetical protein [Thiobacillus sp.]
PAEDQVWRVDLRQRCLSPARKKTKSKTTRRGEFFAAHPTRLIFGNSGLSGSPSFGYFSWRDKKSD